MIKVKMYTTIGHSIGNVIAGDSHIIECQAVKDKGDYYSVVVHANREVRYSKKYWAMERL